jgi:hypothetical protein
MNDKELFWSLISPYLVDRPDAYNRVSWDIDYIMEDNESFVNWDFQRFIMFNHIFKMPSNLRWRDDFTPYNSRYESMTLTNYPHSMIITQSKDSDKTAKLYLILNGIIILLRLTQMHNSKTEYVIGNFKDALDLSLFKIGESKYAIVGGRPNFINWNINPLEVKSNV